MILQKIPGQEVYIAMFSNDIFGNSCFVFVTEDGHYLLISFDQKICSNAFKEKINKLWFNHNSDQKATDLSVVALSRHV